MTITTTNIMTSITMDLQLSSHITPLESLFSLSQLTVNNQACSNSQACNSNQACTLRCSSLTEPCQANQVSSHSQL